MYIHLNSFKITCKNIIFQDNVNFDIYTMRDHLIKCIESQQFSPFPKTKPTRTKVLSLKNTSVNFSIEKSVQLGVICRICLKIWYVVIDVLLCTITVVSPATTQTLFLVVYRLPAQQSWKLAPDQRNTSDKFPGGPVVFVISPDRLSGKLFWISLQNIHTS